MGLVLKRRVGEAIALLYNDGTIAATLTVTRIERLYVEFTVWRDPDNTYHLSVSKNNSIEMMIRGQTVTLKLVRLVAGSSIRVFLHGTMRFCRLEVAHVHK